MMQRIQLKTLTGRQFWHKKKKIRKTEKRKENLIFVFGIPMTVETKAFPSVHDSSQYCSQESCLRFIVDLPGKKSQVFDECFLPHIGKRNCIEKQNGRILLEDNKLKLSELNDNKKYTEVSFMIFRTGSCLIVGNCSENIH